MKLNSGPVVFVLCAVALTWWGYNKFSEHRAAVAYDARRKMHQDTASAALNQAVVKYNAITDWGTKTSLRFSIDLQKVMMNVEGRPIVVEGMVNDIAHNGDHYSISILVFRPTSVEFILDCDMDLANRMASQLPVLSSCAVIAQISSVEKAAFKLHGAHGEDESIEVDSGDNFIARGRCVEWVNPDAY